MNVLVADFTTKSDMHGTAGNAGYASLIRPSSLDKFATFKLNMVRNSNTFTLRRIFKSMKITASQLRKIIVEEIENLSENYQIGDDQLDAYLSSIKTANDNLDLYLEVVMSRWKEAEIGRVVGMRKWLSSCLDANDVLRKSINDLVKISADPTKLKGEISRIVNDVESKLLSGSDQSI